MFRKGPYVEDRFRTKIKGLYCVYCGALADTEDHFPPVSETMSGFLLPCCRECNSLAGSMHGRNFWERVKQVKAKLKKRHERDLRVPNWSSEELDEMGHDMQRDIKLCLDKRRIVQSRLAWNVEGYLASIGHGRNSALISAGWDTTTE